MSIFTKVDQHFIKVGLNKLKTEQTQNPPITIDKSIECAKMNLDFFI
jgi:hypothetical protein